MVVRVGKKSQELLFKIMHKMLLVSGGAAQAKRLSRARQPVQ